MIVLLLIEQSLQGFPTQLELVDQVCMLVVPRSWSSKAESCLRKPTLGLLTGRLARTKS